MIRLRTLGSIGLEDAAGQDLSAVLRQPKRFGLFAYLALARPRGYHRRDTLLLLFWPELDDEHARAALRQSLYTLRRGLPPDTILARGGAEIGLAPGAVWCDVHAFEEALAEGRRSDALSLYQGDLLSGYHLADAAPELDYWLAAERERLRGLALQCAWDGAETAEANGDIAAARRFARRAGALAPLDEETAQRQVRLLHRSGDLTGAVRVFERWAGRLRAELEVEPSPRMMELVASLRQELSARAVVLDARTAPAPTAARTVVADPGDVDDAIVESTTAPGSDPGGRRPDVLGTRKVAGRGASVTAWLVGSALLLVLVAGAITVRPRVSFEWTTSRASTAAERVMILPFAYRGGPDAAYLSEGLVYLFSVALDGGGVRSIDPHAVVRRAGMDGVHEYDANAAARMGERMDATHLVVGNVVETEGRLQINTSLYERDGMRLLARASAGGPGGAVPQLVDQIAAELLTSRPVGRSSRVTRLAGVTTESLPALKAYLEGESRLRTGAFGDAVTAFEAAVMEDTLFALAHYRLSLAASWAFRGGLASDAAARAMRHADRLPERERRLLAAHAAYRLGEATEAVAALRGLAAMYPDDAEVWYRLGEVLLHFGPPNGWPLADAREPFRRAAQLEPMVAEIQYHLAQIETALGSRDAALAVIDGALESAPGGGRAPQLRMLRALLVGDGRGGSWRSVLEELARSDDFTVISATYNAAVYAGRPERALELAKLLAAPGRPLSTRLFGHLLSAELELALGRWGAAAQQIGEIRRLDDAVADEVLALLASAPPAAPARDELALLLPRLARRDVRDIQPATPWWPEPEIRALGRHYARGIVALLLGEEGVRQEAATRLRSEPGDNALADQLAGDLDLAAAWRHARPAGTAPRAPVISGRAEIAVLSPLYSRPARRFDQARALETEGLLREALQWYESLAVFSVHDLPWAVPALVDRARLHEALDEPREAAALYRRFLALWVSADEDPLGLRAQARAGLGRTDAGSERGLPVWLTARPFRE